MRVSSSAKRPAGNVAARNLPVDTSAQAIPTSPATPCPVRESWTNAARKLLSHENRPDAIFGVNDTVAFAAMNEIRGMGLKIPDDVAIIGFTDEYHAGIVRPALTSIQHPTYQIGRSAAELFFMILNGEKTPEKIELGTELHIRESSGRV